MEDERASRTSETGGSAPVNPPQVHVRHRSQTERVPPRVLGRLVNRLDASHWYTSIPAAVRAMMFEMLCDDGQWLPPSEVSNLFGPPLCDGSPETCHFHDAENAAFDLLQDQPAQVINVIDTGFSPGDLVGLAENIRTQEFRGSADVVTISSRIINYVEDMEHRLHTYGVRMTAREGREVARVHLARYLLLLAVAFQVPVTDAAESSSSENWAEFLERLERKALLVGYDLNTLRMYLRHVAQLNYECHYFVTVATHQRVVSACSSGDLPRIVCKDFFSTTGNDPLAARRVYDLPDRRCGYVFTDSLWRSSATDFLFWCSLVVLMLGIFWATVKISRIVWRFWVRVVSFFVKIVAAGVTRGRSSLTAMHSYIMLRRDVALVRVAEVQVDQSVLAPPTTQFFKMVNAGSNSLDSLEMSIRGSEIRVSGVIPGCMHLAVVYEGQVTFVGMGFRYNEYLVTAQHNINAMTSCPGKYYLIPFRPNRNNEVCELDMDKMLELTPKMIESDIVSSDFAGYDVAIIPVDPAAWSMLAVKTLTYAEGVWNANVTVYGLEKSGRHKLQRSLGTILRKEEDPLHMLFYTASTLKGWSGSPVLTGHRRVVALHCGTNGEVNHGLNFVVVRFIIDIYESSRNENSEDAERRNILKSSRGRAGRLAMREEELEFERREDEAIENYKVYIQQAKNGQVWFSTRDVVERARASHAANFADGDTLWHDESAISPSPIVQKPMVVTDVEELTAGTPGTPRSKGLFAYAEGAPFIVSHNGLCLNAPHYKGLPADSERFFDFNEARSLGYDPGAYGMPRATDRESAIKRSKCSLSKSLEDAVEVRLNAITPPACLRHDVKSLLMSILAPLKYAVDGEGVTEQKIQSQLNSSAVSCSKSPGLPYVTEYGVTTNAELLALVGVEDLAKTAYSKYKVTTWEQPSINFLKIEPTKVEKLDQGLDRCVQAVGLDAQLYFRCHFGALGDVAAAQYKKNPVMCGWSPLKPGDGEWLYNAMRKRFKGKAFNKIFEYDGKAFEFVAHTQEAYSDVSDIMVALAVPAANVSNLKMRLWRAEARAFLDDMGRSGYQMADGTLVSKTVPFVLNSGRWDTFIRNSITGLYWMLIGLLESGYSVEQIHKEFVLKVGGDDAILAVPPSFDAAPFVESLTKYGMKIHKVQVKDFEDGFDFFSWKFSKTNRGHVQWIPTRFTKHVTNLLNCSHENRPQALIAHMLNWVHSPAHFDFFRKIYMRGYDADREAYSLSKLPDRSDLLSHLRGFESLVSDFDSVEAFLASASN